MSEILERDAMVKVGAIILGGGRGTRLYPLTKVRAKPAVPLCGRYRLVDIPISNCIHSGINKIVVLTQFNSHSLNRHINHAYRFDHFSGGYVDVLTAEQTDVGSDWFQGTADAVRKQLMHIRNIGVDYYIVLSGDQLYRMDYRDLLNTHLRKGADITVAALPVSRKDAKGFGVMKVFGNGRIKEFVEKPKDEGLLDSLVTPEALFSDFGMKAEGKPYMASMGVYVFKATLLESLLEQHPEWVDFGKELIPHSLKQYQVCAHPFDGFWEDIGTVRSYFDVSMEMTTERAPFNLHDPLHPIFTHARALPGVRISDTHVDKSIICEGTQISKASISQAIIGIRSIVRPGAQIDKSIILGAEYIEAPGEQSDKVPLGIGEHAVISEAIVDQNARIGKKVVIRGSKKLKDCDGDGYAIRDGIVIVFKNAVIPDGTVIG